MGSGNPAPNMLAVIVTVLAVSPGLWGDNGFFNRGGDYSEFEPLGDQEEIPVEDQKRMLQEVQQKLLADIEEQNPVFWADLLTSAAQLMAKLGPPKVKQALASYLQRVKNREILNEDIPEESWMGLTKPTTRQKPMATTQISAAAPKKPTTPIPAESEHKQYIDFLELLKNELENLSGKEIGEIHPSWQNIIKGISDKK